MGARCGPDVPGRAVKSDPLPFRLAETAVSETRCRASPSARNGAFRHRPKGPEAFGPIGRVFPELGRKGAVEGAGGALQRSLQAVLDVEKPKRRSQGSWVLGPPYHCPDPPAVPFWQAWFSLFGVLSNVALGFLLRSERPCCCSWSHPCRLLRPLQLAL